MSEKVMKMPTGSFRLSRIIYLTDMQHSDSHEIPIGVVGEATLDRLRAIGIAVRPHFAGAELAAMGPIARKRFKSPMDALWPELKAAFDSSSSESVLDEFASRHFGSLSVFAPSDVKVPRQWLLETDNKKLKESVTERMRVTLIDSYYELFFPPRSPIEDPSFEEASKRAA
ncbi:MAG: hypothetical protein ACHQAY_10230 [Hyphomicrobiales bacterium]